MIIVEGADNVGKSTLVTQLLGLDPTLRFLDRPRFRPGQGETIADSYRRALFPLDGRDYDAQAHSIADRFLASECIYGELFRGGCRITPEQHIILRGILIQYSATVVWCDPPDDAIKATWHTREQLYSEAQSLAIAEAYRARIHDVFHGFPIVHYDWTQSHAETQRKAIIRAHSLTRKLWLYPVTCTPPTSPEPR
jgi:hypothetical protein